MHHAITVGGLLLTIGIIVGAASVGFGLLVTFAGMMSDAPDTNGSNGFVGCAFLAGGAILLVGCILGIAL